ncbi:MAG TPA: pectin acetylesterase-family hydrolase [Kofleriaceae bacterium]|jgi:hypothetical protein
MRAALLLVLVAACGGSSNAADGAAADAPAIDTPENTWTWVPIAGTFCGNGTEAGIGVNRTSASQDLLVYFEGGGACWDYDSCFTQNLAVNIDITYDAAKFASDIGATPLERGGPFANATFVFVPYCTGDLHAGQHVATYEDKMVHHVGATNTAAFVAALQASFPGAQHVWVAGSSAGGYGATLNLDRFTSAWPTADVPLLQDSSPFVPPLANYDAWQTSWDLQYPPGCNGCATNFSSVISTLVAANPSSRIGLLTYNNDAVVSAYFGYTSLVDATNTLVANEYSGPTAHVFELAGTSHTMLGGLATIVAPSGTSLATWVTQWATADAAWANLTP